MAFGKGLVANRICVVWHAQPVSLSDSGTRRCDSGTGAIQALAAVAARGFSASLRIPSAQRCSMESLRTAVAAA
jgi:hypothetical protein